MELITVKVPVDFNYFHISCTHFGSIFHHQTGWEMFVDMLHSKIDGLRIDRNKVIHHGDVVDFVDPRDPRFSIEEYNGEKQLLLGQISEAKKRMEGLRGHLLTLLMGNHEWKKLNILGNATKDFCKYFGVPYGGWTSKITFVNRRGEFMFKHYATHGATSISSSADDPIRQRTNKLLSLKRKLRKKASDCGLMSRAHTHWNDRLKPESDFYFLDDGKEVQVNRIKADYAEEYIHPDLRWYVSVGSLYKSYEAAKMAISYAERQDYDPLPCGFQLCKIRSSVISQVEPVWVD